MARKGLGMFNANRNILVKGSKREGCEIFSMSTPEQKDRKTKAGDESHLLLSSIRCYFRKGSSEKNVADINLRTCI